MLTQNYSHFIIAEVLKEFVDDMHVHAYVAGLQIQYQLAMTCTYLESQDYLNVRACII